MTDTQHRSDPFLAIDRALHDDERETFLRRFTHHNPHWRGAHVADILSELDNADAMLRQVEDFFEVYERELTMFTDYARRFVGSAVRAIVLIHDEPKTPPFLPVMLLVARAVAADEEGR